MEKLKGGVIRVAFWPDTPRELIVRAIQDAGCSIVGSPVGDDYEVSMACQYEDAMVAHFKKQHVLVQTAERIKEGEVE